jgi:hypothetical protein
MRQTAKSEDGHIWCCSYWLGVRNSVNLFPAGAGGTTPLSSQSVHTSSENLPTHRRISAAAQSGRSLKFTIHPSRAKVKNEWSYIRSRPRHLQVLHSGDCTLTPTVLQLTKKNCQGIVVKWRDWFYFAGGTTANVNDGERPIIEQEMHRSVIIWVVMFTK